jgi:glycosyltransferase involved in cell wall biosynthesis
MTPAAPRVSVLLPVKNGMPYFHEALASVLAQSFTDFEVIVIDDHGVDDSIPVARLFADPRIVIVDGGGQGLAHALNVGLNAARGEYIARHDADDTSAPDRLQRQVAYLDQHPDVGVVASRTAFIDQRGEPTENNWTRAVATQWDQALSPAAIAALMPQTCCIVHGSVMTRRALIVEQGGYNAALPVSQDYDLWLRLLPHCQFAKLPERLYSFRIHPLQTSAARGREQARQSISAKLRYLMATQSLPAAPRAGILGSGTGVTLYRDAVRSAGWTEVPASEDCDVAIFTNFDSLDRDMSAILAATAGAFTRVGNFLLPHPSPRG